MVVEVLYQVLPSRVRGEIHSKIAKILIQTSKRAPANYKEAIIELAERAKGIPVFPSKVVVARSQLTHENAHIAHHLCGSYFSTWDLNADPWLVLYWTFLSILDAFQAKDTQSFLIGGRKVLLVLKDIEVREGSDIVYGVHDAVIPRMAYVCTFGRVGDHYICELRELVGKIWPRIKMDYENIYFFPMLSAALWGFVLGGFTQDIWQILEGVEEPCCEHFLEQAMNEKVIVFRYVVARMKSFGCITSGDVENGFKYSSLCLQMLAEYSHILTADTIRSIVGSQFMTDRMLDDSTLNCMRCALFMLDFKKFKDFERQALFKFTGSYVHTTFEHIKDTVFGLIGMYTYQLVGDSTRVTELADVFVPIAKAMGFPSFVNMFAMHRDTVKHFATGEGFGSVVLSFGRRLLGTNMHCIYVLMATMVCTDQGLYSDSLLFIEFGIAAVAAVTFHPALRMLRATVNFLLGARVGSTEAASYIARSCFAFNNTELRSTEAASSDDDDSLPNLSDEVAKSVEKDFEESIDMAREKKNMYWVLYCTYGYILYLDTQINRASSQQDYVSIDKLSDWKSTRETHFSSMKRIVSTVDLTLLACRLVENCHSHIHGQPLPYPSRIPRDDVGN